jgi:hypothetical protein
MSEAILNTLCYADIFDYPLTEPEIYRYCISSRPITTTQISKELARLVQNRRIETEDWLVGPVSLKIYCLPGKTRLFRLRHHRELVSAGKIKIGLKIGNWLKLIPTIKAVYLTGSLAMLNCQKKDDIDLMIITSPSSLWLTRFLVTAILLLLGKKRSPGHHEKSVFNQDKICTNLYLTETNLALPPPLRNLYTAHEVIQAKPVWSKDRISSKFIAANAWISTYLANASIPAIPFENNLKPDRSPIIGKLDAFFYLFQWKYMKSKITREQIDKHKAFFHPRDTAGSVIKAYNSRRTKYL